MGKKDCHRSRRLFEAWLCFPLELGGTVEELGMKTGLSPWPLVCGYLGGKDPDQPQCYSTGTHCYICFGC